MFGYSTTEDPDTVRHGPQPYEAIVSEICEAFGCTPDVAERQDRRLVGEILDYRLAKSALAVFELGEKGIGIIQRHPELAQILLEMRRAQLGTEASPEELMADMAKRTGDDGS